MFGKSERGQVLLVSALLAPVLLGMVGIAVDVGGYADDKRTLQNSADAIALAAAQDLCKPDCTSTTQAINTGQAWATKNGIPLANVTITVSGGSSAPKVTAQVSKNHKFHFMQLPSGSATKTSVRAPRRSKFRSAATAASSPGGNPGHG